MTFLRVSCVTVTCDGCDAPFDFEDGSITVHFDSPTQALTEARDYGWEASGDMLFCDQCKCARKGHPLGDYSVCDCGDMDHVCRVMNV